MKKVLLVLALLAGSVSLSQAQQQFQQRSPEERAKMQTERLSERLQLSADQKTKIEAIFLAQSKSQDSLRKASGEGTDRQAMFQKMTPIREQTNKKVEAVLTEEQKKAYATYLQEMRNRMGQGGRQGGERPNN